MGAPKAPDDTAEQQEIASEQAEARAKAQVTQDTILNQLGARLRGGVAAGNGSSTQTIG